jgi:glutamate/tyrosine decarboxylase-like PLP-dependent enzyme
MKRITPLSMNGDTFRTLGHELVERIAAFLDSIEDRPVTTGESPAQLQPLLGNGGLPEHGMDAHKILGAAADFLFDHSLLNGHPKFSGYITSSPTPIGALADMLAATVNPNVGANVLSPAATEIEKQTIQWLAELIGLPAGYGGVLVSGGNMANFTAFLAGRTAKAPKQVKQEGISSAQKLVVYCSKATHTWIEKAVVLFGLGTNAVHWIETDDHNRMDTVMLERMITEDLAKGFHPIMVIGNAGDVSTGAVDDLKTIGRLCKQHDLWFHIDGAYGIPAAVIPALKPLFAGIEDADSLALDPHKWLYSPLEAGCTLVKDPNHLLETFSSHPVYYNFGNDEQHLTVNYYEYGLQNSRGFRALKVWLALQQAGRKGYEDMIAEDIRLSKLMFTLAEQHTELEAVTQCLSITTFRYIPKGADPADSIYLNKINESLLNELQHGGKVFMSNAVLKERYCLRSCIVNFRTSEHDVMEIMDIVVEEGRKLVVKERSLAS